MVQEYQILNFWLRKDQLLKIQEIISNQQLLGLEAKLCTRLLKLVSICSLYQILNNQIRHQK